MVIGLRCQREELQTRLAAVRGYHLRHLELGYASGEQN